MDALRRLCGLRTQVERLALGLMSGMSADGLDLALVRLTGLGRRPRVELLASRTAAYPAEVRARIRAAIRGSTRDVAVLGFELAERWAAEVLAFLAEARTRPEQVDVLGSHGQTLDHVPRVGGHPARTLQVGEGDVLAERTGILTVSDFRPRDVAAGGEGAPLVPFADWVLHARESEPVACQNLGSIANVTLLTPGLEDVLAFDTGPANALIDGVIRLSTRDETAIDVDGARAARGAVDARALAFLAERCRPFLERPPPKSAGYDDFGPPLARALVDAHPAVPPDDLLATAVAFSARTLAAAYETWVLPRCPTLERIHLTGGGARNAALVRAMREALAPLGLRIEIPPAAWIDAKEAVAFALLADATVRGLASNVASATGACRAVPLGKISLASASVAPSPSGAPMAETPLHVPLEVLPHGRGLDLPSYATPGAAGLDLRAALEVPLVLAPGDRALVPTGLKIAVPSGFEAQVRARSGWALTQGVLLPNAPGTIDSDYRGEVKVILANLGDEPVRVERGMRVAQLVFAPVAHARWDVREHLDETPRGPGGFGHTGHA